jgi:hypothetical protein
MSKPSSLHLLKLAIYVLSNRVHQWNGSKIKPYEQLALRWCKGNFLRLEGLLRSREPTAEAFAEAIWVPAIETADMKLVRRIVAGLDVDAQRLIKPSHIVLAAATGNVELAKLLIETNRNIFRLDSPELATAFAQVVDLDQTTLHNC